MHMKGIKKIAMMMGLILVLSFLVVAHNSDAQDNSPDAIAIRIIPNPNHYSISRWYTSQNFTGSPQALTVDGYEAIRDGRTVYVNAANIDPTSRTIYTNIYLISYNQESEAKTVDILGQIISHWKFNDNIIENNSPAPSCSISSLNCKSDSDCGSGQSCALAGPLAGSCVLNNLKNCSADSDCPANFFCDGLKAKITRDIKRVGRLEEIRGALYNFKQTNKRYPTLLAGTYLTNNSLSVWPSWKQVLLSDLAVSNSFVDPINKLGKCVIDLAVKNGRDYSATTAACNLNSGVTTASCNNATWDYNFQMNGGDYRLWVETANNNTGGIYGDLSSAPALFAFGENFCPEPGIQHHLLVYVDNVLKGSACNPAVNPNESRQTAYVDLGHLDAGSHSVRIKWDNDWQYNPDGVWGNADDADSNLKIYRLGLTTSDSFDIETCWDQNSKSFAYSSVNGPLTLPPDSYAFAYVSDSEGSDYSLCATLESRSPSLAYSFGPFDLADSACAFASGVSVGGQAGNSAPSIVSQSLGAEAHQPFNGYIQATDAEGDLLTWSILNSSPGTWSSWQSPSGQNQPPVLQDTSNPYQKKVYAPFAGDPGTYSLRLSINDGQGGILSTTTPITIISPSISLSAENTEYALDSGSSFSYVISFASNSLNNPSTAYSVQKTAGPLDILAGLTKSFINLGNGQYQVKYDGDISPATVNNDTVFAYKFSVTDSYNKTATKNFNVTLKVASVPSLNFSCVDMIRVGEQYSCILGPTMQGESEINYVASGLPNGLSQDLGVITGAPNSSASGIYTVNVTAANSFGAVITKSFSLKVNNFCGDGIRQQPNTEGRGGPANNGQESCDGSSGVTTSPTASRVNLQYACNSSLCIYKSPINGGGYCGDGYCQLRINGQDVENHSNCSVDCDAASLPCTPSCVGKCFGASDGCTGTCPDNGANSACTSGESIFCSDLVGPGYAGSALCKSDCSGFDINSCGACNPSCTGVCAGADNGCGVACPSTATNTFCTSSYSEDCSTYLNWPPESFSGNVVCNSSCSAYDTSGCDASGSYWYQVPASEDRYLTVGTDCMVRLNVDANNNIECIMKDNPNSSSQWFQGVIAISVNTKICAVPGCATAVNTTKCRYFSGVWTNHCFVHKTW